MKRDFFPTESKGRLEWIDAGKGLCMLMVVFFHCEMYFSPMLDDSLSRWFAFMRQPFFFFLSGCVFCPDITRFDFRRKLGGLLRVVLFTYFFFTSIIVLPKSLLDGESVSEGIWLILTGRASWFIISLGVCQLIYALVFRYISRKRQAVPVTMLTAVALWWCVKQAYNAPLPYFADAALLVCLFFGLGILFRWHSREVERILGLGPRCLVISGTIYIALCWMDFAHLNSTRYIFNDITHINWPLSILYSIVAIVFMTTLMRMLPTSRLLLSVGRNSLVFYYLNGGVIRVMATVATALLHIAPSTYCHTAAIFAMASPAILVCALAIRRHFPILIGDRKAWQNLKEKAKPHPIGHNQHEK